MGALIPLMFLFFPALELWVLIQVGKEIGALATVALVFLSVVIGLFLLRLRGLSVAKTMQADLAAGRIPANPLVDAFCLMIAGWLFIFPGFVSDVMALLLIVPGVRHLLLALFASRMKKRGFAAQATYFNATGSDSGVTWTYATGGNNAQPARGSTPGSDEKRGNAVIIDCEPGEVASTKEVGDGDAVIDVSDKPPKQ